MIVYFHFIDSMLIFSLRIMIEEMYQKGMKYWLQSSKVNDVSSGSIPHKQSEKKHH